MQAASVDHIFMAPPGFAALNPGYSIYTNHAPTLSHQPPSAAT
jgi:hypothetical protein